MTRLDMEIFFFASETASIKAKNKGWFGVLKTLDSLDRSWTILQVTAQYAAQQLDFLESNEDYLADAGGPHVSLL